MRSDGALLAVIPRITVRLRGGQTGTRAVLPGVTRGTVLWGEQSGSCTVSTLRTGLLALLVTVEPLLAPERSLLRAGHVMPMTASDWINFIALNVIYCDLIPCIQWLFLGLGVGFEQNRGIKRRFGFIYPYFSQKPKKLV